MKYIITGLLLMAFAVPSWAEGDVWYCSQEKGTGFNIESEGIWEEVNYSESKFMLKKIGGRFIVLKGKAFGSQQVLDCEVCIGELVVAHTLGISFRMQSDKFAMTRTKNNEVGIWAGTCEKF